MKPLVRRQDVGQTIPDRTLPAVPTPCTVAPAAPALAPGEGAGRPTNVVDQHGGVVTILGVAAPGPLILTTGLQSQVDLHLLLILSGQPALGALPPPCTQTIAVAAVGAAAPHLWCRQPGPGAGGQNKAQVQGSGVGAAAVGPEHGARHSFLYPPPNCLRTSVASRLPIAPL